MSSTDSATAPVALHLAVGSGTDVGLRRKVNEDSLLAQHPVYIVADGMGGHEAGDKASQAVVLELSGLVGKDAVTPNELADSLDRAHAAVRVIAEGTSRGAGSTLTGVVISDQGGRPHWLVFNIGDSRVYLLRSGDFVQLTVDHSIAQEMIDDGTLAREDLATYAGRNVITKAVGADHSDADFWLYPIVTGDRLVLCSDGLSGEVTDEGIAAHLVANLDPQAAADALVADALAHGGRDNVTVLVIDAIAGGISVDIEEATIAAEARPAEIDDMLEDTTIELPRRGGRGVV
ncbi:serine/threonine-protein phosphatase [Glaciihabitans arcticus]|uniref:Serine/threonine-protein phosphatase n=1 Tax=Glaciihabitans arcticus TaxID=2668039 RepID=A0A4Q9GUH2_9MICO|nr:protein phosphatase 2C domain-containing protein [Glaciihabitans arcticus]TBN57854.1 serine/threonine-protein phosphatase [Glaciihabitans arcticus]